MEVVFDDGSERVRFFSPFISEKEYKLAWRDNRQIVLFLTLSVTLNTSSLPKQKAWWRFVLLMCFSRTYWSLVFAHHLQ